MVQSSARARYQRDSRINDRQRDLFYQAILQALAPRQIALLRALAVEPSKTILSNRYISRHDLGSIGGVQAALKKLRSTIRVLLIYVTAAIALITAGGIIPAWAGDDPGDLINYSFAVWIGSGVYKVKSADKRFAVLRAPFAYTLREAQYDKAALRDKLGYRLLLPALVRSKMKRIRTLHSARRLLSPVSKCRYR